MPADQEKSPILTGSAPSAEIELPALDGESISTTAATTDVEAGVTAAATTEETAAPTAVGKTGSCQFPSLKLLAFPMLALVFQVIMIILYATCTEYGGSSVAPTKAATTPATGGAPATAAKGITDVEHYYPMFQDVHVMIFVGFGFLMTFLKKYGYSAVGLNFVIAAVVIQWSILSNSFWHQVFEGAEHAWHRTQIDIATLITADFAAAAVLITFGAVLGKVTPAQLLVIALVEIVFYSLNERIGAGELGAVDMGGSVFVHTFGAYFGLACSMGLGFAFTRGDDAVGAVSKHCICMKKEIREATAVASDEAEELNESTKTSDLFSMVGTLFLWMFWPSFNGALATGDQQHRVVINTLLSLCACCVSAFLCSVLLRGLSRQHVEKEHHAHVSAYKFDMVDIQNATLAGGVAVGSAADLVIDPWGALLIGTIAGFVSVAGYVFVQPFLHRAIGLHDTCGVHNLHGMPGILGGLGGIIAAAMAGKEKYGVSIATVFPKRGGTDGRTAGEQAYYQFIALVITFVIACSSGFFTGILVRIDTFPCIPEGKRGLVCCSQTSLFDDAEYWSVPDVDFIEGAAAAAVEDGDVVAEREE